MKWSPCLPWKSCLLAAGLWAAPLGSGGLLRAQPELPAAEPVAAAQDRPAETDRTGSGEAGDNGARGEKQRPPSRAVDPTTLLNEKVLPISLDDALRLAGVQNPDIQRARALTAGAMANRFAAIAVLMPNLNVGTNFDAHTGNLQQSNGNIIKVNREALDFGLGAGTVAAGTASIPGLYYNLNIDTAFFNALRSRQLVRERQLDTAAVKNQVLLRVAWAYCELLRAEGRWSIARQVREDAGYVARITRVQAEGGQTKISDAERAATVERRRVEELTEAENNVVEASARLAQVLNLDPSCRLHAIDGWAVPAPLVPPNVPLNKLVVIAVGNRPELAAQQAVIRQALLSVQSQRLLPFSPTLILGFSASDFGGGSNLAGYPPGVAPTPAFGSVGAGVTTTPTTAAAAVLTTQQRFGNFAERVDEDAIFYWTVQNLGVGNWAMVRQAQAVLAQTKSSNLIVLNQVRRQVAQSYANSYASYAQLDTSEQALRTSLEGFQMDKDRTFNKVGLPIETLDSLRLLADARYAYLDAIIGFNQAHFALYVALGSPPADMLARAVPATLVPPPPDARLNPGPPCSPPYSVPDSAAEQGKNVAVNAGPSERTAPQGR